MTVVKAVTADLAHSVAHNISCDHQQGDQIQRDSSTHTNHTHDKQDGDKKHLFCRRMSR